MSEEPQEIVEAPLPFHWSPHAIMADWDCPRKLFWRKFAYGTGIEPATPAFELELGKAIHAVLLDSDLTEPARELGQEAETTIKALVEQYNLTEPLRTEWPIFARGLVYAFRSRVWPDVLRDHEVVRVEEDIRVLLPGPSGPVPFITRPDLLLRHRSTGGLYYWELKTTGLDPQRFCRIWERHPQLLLGMWAMEQSTGEAVDGSIVQGLHKGSTYKGSLRGPFITAYCGKGPLTKDQWSREYRKGYDRRLITEHPEGIEGWIDQLESSVIAESFPMTPPIAPDPELTIRLLNQVVHRSEQILMSLGLEDEEVTELTFPQHLSSCQDALTGNICPFSEVCWNSVVAADPLKSGLYKQREE